MNAKDKVYDLLDEHGNSYAAVARAVYDGPKAVALAVLHIGVETIAAKRRAATKRELKKEIRPSFVQRKGGAKHSVKLSSGFLKEQGRRTEQFLSDWKIGRYDLAGFTKKNLIDEALRERKSGYGHVLNAEFYEQLAKPMSYHETVLEHWKTPAAAKKIRDDVTKRHEGKLPGFVEMRV